MATGIGTLIIDLDDTIVDSSSLSALRQQRDWRGCVRSLHETKCFTSLHGVLLKVVDAGIKIGIVTSSVSFYAESVLRHHKIPYHCLIAYHDAKPRKPHPAPVLACLGKLSATSEQSLGIGDAEIDCQAYQAAGLRAYGAGWSHALETDGEWDAILQRPSDLLKALNIS